MTALLILGAGGHGGVVADAAAAAGGWTEIAFLDDAARPPLVHGRWPVLGPTALAGSLLGRYGAAAVAIGAAGTRLALLEGLAAAGFALPVLRHPFSAVGVGVSLGAGTVVLAGAVVNAGARLGRGCIVNTGATVDHDCILGDGVHVCPGAHLAGEVTVGERTWLGIGCCVREGIRIGAGATIGAGAAVVSDLPDGVTATGIPARGIRR
jgi:sugar O-acyltransferase (sialic acid O-acetyltransferase NeuD family)